MAMQYIVMRGLAYPLWDTGFATMEQLAKKIGFYNYGKRDEIQTQYLECLHFSFYKRERYDMVAWSQDK